MKLFLFLIFYIFCTSLSFAKQSTLYTYGKSYDSNSKLLPKGFFWIRSNGDFVRSFKNVAVFFEVFVSSIEGEGDSSFLVISFSTVCCSTTGGSKKVAQTTKTKDESTIASNTFFPSIYFFPFLKLGAGSNPLLPPRILIG